MFKVELIGDVLVFSNGETKQATDEEKRYFSRRKVLKAIKKTLRDKDGNEYQEWDILRWADLHRHSGYSFLDGAIRIKDMVKKTEVCGAITDHGNMCGALDFYKAMKAAGKLPIIGQEFYVENVNGEKKGNHLLLLAKKTKDIKTFLNCPVWRITTFIKSLI